MEAMTHERENVGIAEDELDPGIPLRDRFAANGFNSIWYSNVDAVTEAIKFTPFRAVLLDVHMPSSTTVEAALLTRRLQPGAYLVGFSGVRESLAADRMRDICDAFFDKPLDLDEVYESVVRGCVERCRLLRESLDIPGELLPPPPSPVQPAAPDAETDPDLRAFLGMEAELKEKYLGQFVAFLDGKFVSSDPDADALAERVFQEHGREDVFVAKVTERPEVIRIRHPARVLRYMNRRS